jgi:hypothetical protein
MGGRHAEISQAALRDRAWPSLSLTSGKATLIGKGLTKVECASFSIVKRVQSMRDSSTRSTVSRKLLQWYCVWKPIKSAPSIPSNSSRCHGQIPNDSGFGHGMCQNSATRASGRASFNKARKEREVIVLRHHHRLLEGLDLLQRRARELLVGAAVVQPVLGPERSDACARCGTGPQTLVREAVVVAVLLFLRQRDALEQVLRILGRNAHAAAWRRLLSKSASPGAVRDPSPARSALAPDRAR